MSTSPIPDEVPVAFREAVALMYDYLKRTCGRNRTFLNNLNIIAKNRGACVFFVIPFDLMPSTEDGKRQPAKARLPFWSVTREGCEGNEVFLTRGRTPIESSSLAASMLPVSKED